MNAEPKSTGLPSIDADAIRIYCDVVFGYLDGLVPIRALSETGTPSLTPHLEFPSTKDVSKRLASMSSRAAETKRGLYVVPGTVGKAGSAKASDILQSGVLLVDLDKDGIATARGHLVRYLGEPSLEVASGGRTRSGSEKLHLYWRLTEPAQGADLTLVARLRATIADKVGGDGAFSSIHQPIRVPGTIHGKHGVKSPVRLLTHKPVEYHLDDLAERVDAMPPLPGQAWDESSPALRAHGPTIKELATTPIHAGNADELSRFEAMSRVIGHWIRNARDQRCSLEDALEHSLNHNAALIRPSWDEARVRREFDALLNRDIKQNGPIHRASESGDDAGRQASSPIPPELSDDALAAGFVNCSGGKCRHIPAWNAWQIWNGRAWERDETVLVRERMRQHCRSAATRAETPREARRIASDKTIAAALRVAASDPAIASRTSDWDAHPMLLNTPAGVVDLETGEIKSHDRTLLLTQITSASPGSGCEQWLEFLTTVTDGDAELQAYLKRLAGYCLTGSTTEQVFAFLHGTGGNGKSVFLQTIAGILGSYAATATLETFMSSKTDRHLTELAGLRAARLVVVPETEAGRSWSEARIKTITGGENIRANFMRCDHFEFKPQFKLVVMGNHRPGLSTIGESMQRRLHVVPFTITIPPERRDRALTDKLLNERDGILGWMLEGCAEWQSSGLRPPACVLEAAEDYFASEDLVGHWIADCCEERREAWAPSTLLFSSWRSWAESNGHIVGSTKSLGEALRARGLRNGKQGGARGWYGIEVGRCGSLREDAI